MMRLVAGELKVQVRLSLGGPELERIAIRRGEGCKQLLEKIDVLLKERRDPVVVACRNTEGTSYNTRAISSAAKGGKLPEAA